jgi:hypothetical protein
MFFAGAYSVPALIELGAKIACILHAIRNGRNLTWIWLILIFPLGGPLIYFVVEIWPDLKRGRSNLGLNVRLPQNPEKVIQRLTEELEFSNTVEKRVQLAQAYAAAGRYDEAIDTVAACLRGAFKDDPHLTLELAEIHALAGHPQEALDCLATLDRFKFKDSRAERQLLAARCHEKLDRTDEARRCYEAALETCLGEEARCSYALLLLRLGETEAAAKLFEEIVRNAKHGGGAYRRDNRDWIKQAKTQLQTLASAPPAAS